MFAVCGDDVLNAVQVPEHIFIIVMITGECNEEVAKIGAIGENFFLI